MAKELYPKAETCVIMSITKHQLRGMIERGDIKARGRLIARTEIEKVLGHSIESKIPSAAKEKTELETTREAADLAENRARKIKAEAELKRLELGFETLMGYEEALKDLDNKRNECNEKLARMDTLAATLERRTAEVNETGAEIKDVVKLCNHDLNILRKYYQKLCDKCQSVVLDDLDLDPDNVYKRLTPLNVAFTTGGGDDTHEDIGEDGQL